MKTKTKNKRKNNLNPAVVINGRLNLQTTKKVIEEKFNIIPESILKPGFYNKFVSWDLEKRKDFLKLIGGSIHFKDTEKFLSEIK